MTQWHPLRKTLRPQSSESRGAEPQLQLAQTPVPALTPVSRDCRARLAETAAPTARLRRVAEDCVPALRQIGLHPFPDISTPNDTPQQPLRVGAWNAQQCHFARDSAALLRTAALDIALLTELDIGMGRTGQRDTVAELAAAQGHGALYAPEFLELPNAAENDHGWHCNAITARFAPSAVALIRLPDRADWFIAPRRGQRRLGGRVALAARFGRGAGALVVCSVHLESDTDGAGRAAQLAYLLEHLDRFAAGDPVLIGGDLNAGAGNAARDTLTDPLFATARRAGYHWDGLNACGPTSRISRVTNARQQNTARYDWFLGRGLCGTEATTLAATDADGQAISDHDLISVMVRPE